MGTATDFRSPSLLETKHFDERKLDGSPHFWTRGEFDEALDYMHMNPVRRGLVENPLTWKWSNDLVRPNTIGAGPAG